MQALAEAFWEQHGDDIVEDLRSTYPDPFDLADAAGDLAGEHPIITTGIGIGVGIGTDLLAEEILEEYGDNLGIDTITIPIPDYEVGDVMIWPYEFPINVTIGGEMEINTIDPDWYRLHIELNY